ncbi:MAG: aspartate 1-decarboxylase [Steroidobacteraceae bacterium]
MARQRAPAPAGASAAGVPPSAQVQVVRAKLHGLRVTGSALDYHGSITLDPDHCEAVGILPMEFVDIWNRHSGARLSTYVIYGVRGSRCCILNGAAARTCQVGDAVIICASAFVPMSEAHLPRPRVAVFDAANAVEELLEYRVELLPDGRSHFETVTLAKPTKGRAKKSR